MRSATGVAWMTIAAAGALGLFLARVRRLTRSARVVRRMQPVTRFEGARRAPRGAPVPEDEGGGLRRWCRRGRESFEAWSGQHPLPLVVRRPLQGAALAWAPETVVAASVAGLVGATAMVAVIAGPGLAALVGVAGSVASVSAIVLGAGRADRVVDRDLPAVLDRLATALRAGASLPQAVVAATETARGPLQADLQHVQARLAAGDTVIQAIDRWRRSRTTPSVRTTAAALVIAHRVGGGAARAIDGVAASLRDRASVQREVIALSTQARASAVVIVIAPLAFGLVTGAADQQTWQFLTATPLGLVCLAGGALLDVTGGLWMAWLARSVGRA